MLGDARQFADALKHKVQNILDALDVDATDVEIRLKADGADDDSLVFAFSADGLTIKRVVRLYKSVFKLFARLDLFLCITDKRTEYSIRTQQSPETLAGEYIMVGLCHMLWPDRYDKSLEPYHKVVDAPAEVVLQDVGAEDDHVEFTGETENAVDVKDLCDVMLNTHKYSSNYAFHVNCKTMGGHYEINPLSKAVYSLTTVDGHKMRIEPGMPYQFYFNDEVGDRYFDVVIYLGPGYSDTKTPDTVRLQLPCEIAVDCAFYINEETTWSDHFEWLNNVKLMFGSELPSGLDEAIQDAYDFYNIDFLDDNDTH